MCKHCERITEHPEDKPIVHAFMERTAQRLRERTGHSRLTANDIDVKVEANLFAYGSLGDAQIDDGKGGFVSARTRVLRMLREFQA